MNTPKQAASGPFKALVWLPSEGNVITLRFDDPVDALGACIEHLITGHQARLSDNACAWLTTYGRAAAGEVLAGLKASDHGGTRRAAPGTVTEAPPAVAAAEELAAAPRRGRGRAVQAAAPAAEVPATRPAEPARAARGRRPAQPPAEPPAEPEAPPAAPARRGRGRAVQAAAPEPEAEPVRRRANGHRAAASAVPRAAFLPPAVNA